MYLQAIDVAICFFRLHQTTNGDTKLNVGLCWGLTNFFLPGQHDATTSVLRQFVPVRRQDDRKAILQA